VDGERHSLDIEAQGTLSLQAQELAGIIQEQYFSSNT